MRSVSRFESNLLRILHCFLGQAAVSHVAPAIARGQKRPSCLSRDAVELVKQSLGAGSISMLAHEGAWQRRRHLRGQQVAEGSLWQRTEPAKLGLEFSSASLDFLIWVTAAESKNEIPVWNPAKPSQLTMGDRFLLMSAAYALRETELISKWYRQGVLLNHGMVALLLPDQYAAAKTTPRPDFAPWFQGVGSFILEAMQDRLARRWVWIEHQKRTITDPGQMLRLGRAQVATWSRFMDAAEAAGRRDLCRFLLDASSTLLSEQSRLQDWIGGLDTAGLRIAERTEVYESGSALMRAIGRLRSWHVASQSVGYFDEGYAESQLLKSMWESASMDQTVIHADRIAKELDF